MNYEEKAREITGHYHIPFRGQTCKECEQIPKLAAALQQAVEEEREANARQSESMIGASRHDIAAAIRRELPHRASCKIEGEVA